MTGNQLIHRIECLCGLPAPATTVDRLVAGDGEQAVRGVAASFIASVAALQKAADLGINFFVTHEPTFYNHRDLLETDCDPEALRNSPSIEDPVVRAKLRLIAETGMMVYRFHDLTHRMRPDLIHEGMLECLRWPAVERRDGVSLIRIDPIPLAELSRLIKTRTGGHAVRYIGDPDQICRRVALCVGSPGASAQFAALRHPETDVMLIGETSEWAMGEYVRDAVETGRSLGMIIAGHRNSEEAGMQWIARWLGEGVGIDVAYLPAGDPLRLA